MPKKSHKLLSVLYIFIAIPTAFILWLSYVWDSSQSGWGGDWEYGVLGSIVVILLVIGAIESWFSRESRNSFQKFLVWGPLWSAIIVIGGTILLTIIGSY